MASHRCRDRHRRSRRGVARAGPPHLLPATGGIDRASPPHATPFAITAADGTRLAGWIVPGDASPAPAVIYFGGNAEEVSWTLGDGRWPRAWTRIALNYRGYGTSEGKPGARALLADGLALYDAVATRSDVDRDPDRRVRTQPRHRGCDAHSSATPRGRRDPRVALRFAHRRRPHSLPVSSGVASAAPSIRGDRGRGPLPRAVARNRRQRGLDHSVRALAGAVSTRGPVRRSGWRCRAPITIRSARCARCGTRSTAFSPRAERLFDQAPSTAAATSATAASGVGTCTTPSTRAAPSRPTTSLPKWRPSATSDSVPMAVADRDQANAARAMSALRASPMPVAIATLTNGLASAGSVSGNKPIERPPTRATPRTRPASRRRARRRSPQTRSPRATSPTRNRRPRAARRSPRAGR